MKWVPAGERSEAVNAALAPDPAVTLQDLCRRPMSPTGSVGTWRPRVQHPPVSEEEAEQTILRKASRVQTLSLMSRLILVCLEK